MRKVFVICSALIGVLVTGCLQVPSSPVLQLSDNVIDGGRNSITTSVLTDLKMKNPQWFRDALYSRPSFWYLNESETKRLPNGLAIEGQHDGTSLTERDPIVITVKDYFSKNRFSVDGDIKKYAINEKQNNYRLVFLRDDVQCDLSWHDNSLGRLVVGCITFTHEYLDLYRGLDGLFEEITYWDVISYDGAFAMGNVSYGFNANNEWLAKKSDSQWEILFDGQDYIPCSLLSDHRIPKSFFDGECGLDDGRWVKYQNFLSGEVD